VFQIECNVARGVEALLGSFFQTVLDDALQRGRYAAICLRQICGIFFEDRAHGIGGSLAMKGALAGNHLVENCTEGEDVGAGVDGNAAHLLGRHISCGSHDDAGLCGVGHGGERRVGGGIGLGELGETEIENLHAAVFGEKKIFRLEVAMDYAFFVSGGQAVSDLQCVVECFASWDWSVAQTIAQGLAFEKLGDNVGRSFVSPDIENRENIRVVQGGGGQCLLLEAAEAVWIERNRGRQHLDGDFALEPGIAGAIHLAHASGPERADDFIRT